MIFLRLPIFFLGTFLAIYVFLSAARTFVVPRSTPIFLSRLVFRSIRFIFDRIMTFIPTYEQRDSLMALYAPLCLLLLVPTWLFLTTVGYALIFWSLGIEPWQDAFLLSGSSILTLGLATAESRFVIIIAFTEATVGLILVAMLISYLPTMYAAFSKRETAVSLLEVRAGIPPTAPELVWRLQQMEDSLDASAFWGSWEVWFAELDESHTSLAALVFFRSPRANQSWVNAAGAVLDGAALFQSIVDKPSLVHPIMVIRAGIFALRHIADFFDLPYNPDPNFPEDPIAISRAEFDEAWARLAEQGVPLKTDKELAWRNFAGWRVNYDDVLVALAELTMAPKTSWLSDYTLVPVDPSTGQTGGALKKVR